jgi:hypothetical protein
MPSLHDARLVSLLGALMSAAYCIIAIAMSATVKHGPGNEVNYNPAQVEHSNLTRIMGIFNAMTTVFFAYGGHNVALEIQATIGITEKHPSTVRPMMIGVHWTFVITGMDTCRHALVVFVGMFMSRDRRAAEICERNVATIS